MRHNAENKVDFVKLSLYQNMCSTTLRLLTQHHINLNRITITLNDNNNNSYNNNNSQNMKKLITVEDDQEADKSYVYLTLYC